MEEDSPLLTPEAAGDGGKGRERLLTPEDERVDAHEMAPPGRGSKRRSAEALEPEVQHTDSAPAPGDGLLKSSSTLAALSFMSGTPSAEKYKKVKKVGVGAYGSVFMAENTETKETVAVKVTSRKEDPILGGFPLSLLREICILKRLKHENIVQILEVAQTPTGEPLIVMEYCQSSLLELLNSRKHDLSFSEVKYVIRQVLDATNHMHEKGILHRDLATKNVLFNLSGEIKVCDFGISRMAFGQDEEHGFLPAADLEDPNMIVSLPYRAIELLLGLRKYGPALDVWAAGCIMGEILLCQGGNRRTFFGGEAGNPNKTPQTTIEEIFMICGTPSENTWPGFASLPLLKSFQSSGLRADRGKEHVDMGEERGYIRRFFMQGNGKGANVKYSLTESCYDLLGGLLTLCPAHRITAADALRHDFFNEKPKAEWHAWHWALASKEIPRGDDMRRQEGDQGDDARRLLRQLTKDSVAGADSKGEAGKSAKEKAKEALERRVNEKKQLEQKKIAEQKKLAAKQQSEADGEKLPKGWTKHWSSSKQRFYYHDGRSGKNQWHPP
mmetsp:Transcript_108493/g.188372  ORF Transcript_108493/g.188372 Transcript_108493/m.188372 type:complete len:555 (+) Transcript_108493:80-1744(+)